MKITYLGTTTLLLESEEDRLLLDCHITRPSLMRCFFGRLATDRHAAEQIIKDRQLQGLNAIFISHTHHDHVMDAPYFAARTGAMIVGSPSAIQVAAGGGVSSDRCRDFTKQPVTEVGRIRVTAIPSRHSPAHWYNNDLGQVIEKPLTQPARMRAYREGGSWDFLVENDGIRYLVRPSCSLLPDQLNDVRADVLYLGVGGLAKQPEDWRSEFFAETVGKVKPHVVVPIHWDNFFRPLDRPAKAAPGYMGAGQRSMDLLAAYCAEHGIRFLRQEPMTTVNL